MTADTTPQRIQYLARRNAAFAAHEEWVPRWRAHWALAAAQPESATVRRYIQGEVLDEDARPRHDSVGSAEYISPEARLRNRSALEYHATILADQLDVFDGPVIDRAFLHTHQVLAGAHEGPFAVVRFLRDRQPTTPWVQDFVAAWKAWGA